MLLHTGIHLILLSKTSNLKFKTLFGSIKTQDKIIEIVGKTIKMIDWDVKYLSIKQKKNILSTNFIILPNVFLKPNKG